MWILKFIEENLPIYICLLAAMGILLGVSLIVKGKFQKQRDKMLDGIGVIVLCVLQFVCGLFLPTHTVEKTGVVKNITAEATVEKIVNTDGKHFTYISYDDKYLITLDDEGYYYMLNNHIGEDIELKYKADVMEDGSFDNCKLDSIEIKSQP